MTDEAILYLAYGVILMTLALFGIAMWKAGKDDTHNQT